MVGLKPLSSGQAVSPLLDCSFCYLIILLGVLMLSYIHTRILIVVFSFAYVWGERWNPYMLLLSFLSQLWGWAFVKVPGVIMLSEYFIFILIKGLIVTVNLDPLGSSFIFVLGRGAWANVIPYLASPMLYFYLVLILISLDVVFFL